MIAIKYYACMLIAHTHTHTRTQANYFVSIIRQLTDENTKKEENMNKHLRSVLQYTLNIYHIIL